MLKGPADELHAAGGRAGHEAALHVAGRQPALVHRPQAVHVLGGGHAVRHGALVDPKRIGVEVGLVQCVPVLDRCVGDALQ